MNAHWTISRFPAQMEKVQPNPSNQRRFVNLHIVPCKSLRLPSKVHNLLRDLYKLHVPEVENLLVPHIRHDYQESLHVHRLSLNLCRHDHHGSYLEHLFVLELPKVGRQHFNNVLHFN